MITSERVQHPVREGASVLLVVAGFLFFCWLVRG